MASDLQEACNALSLNDNLRTILECPVCFKVCHSPIFMCLNGHHVCHECRPSLTRCPTCRVEGQPSIRCVTLEKMADQVKHPCANKREGCEAKLNAKDMAKHWETCKANYSCSCLVNISASGSPTQCKWTGDREALVAHVKETHPGNYSEDDVIQCDVGISLKETVRYRRLVSAYGELFWVIFWYVAADNCAVIYSKYIGKKENAANYRGKFVYSSRDGCTENTSLVDTMDLNAGFDFSTSTTLMRLFNPTLEEYMLEGIFSFTAQILKR